MSPSAEPPLPVLSLSRTETLVAIQAKHLNETQVVGSYGLKQFCCLKPIESG